MMCFVMLIILSKIAKSLLKFKINKLSLRLEIHLFLGGLLKLLKKI